METHPNYLESLFCPVKRREAIDSISSKIKKEENEFDGFVGIGLSGHIATVLASMHDKGLGLIRKSLDCHSRNWFEYSPGIRRVVFVDDLVNTGQTLQEVSRVIANHGMELVGVVLHYDHPYNLESEELRWYQKLVAEDGHFLEFLIDAKVRIYR